MMAAKGLRAWSRSKNNVIVVGDKQIKLPFGLCVITNPALGRLLLRHPGSVDVLDPVEAVDLGWMTGEELAGMRGDVFRDGSGKLHCLKAGEEPADDWQPVKPKTEAPSSWGTGPSGEPIGEVASSRADLPRVVVEAGGQRRTFTPEHPQVSESD